MSRQPSAVEASASTVNSTADRAIEILLLFTRERPLWAAQEIADHFGMARSTTYRYLGSLRAHRLIIEVDGGFRLGPRLLQMAQLARAGHSMVQTVSAAMRQIGGRFQEIVILSQRIGSEVVSLDRVESPHRVSLTATRADILPWPTTGSAKVLLAFADPSERAGLKAQLEPVAYTEHTIRSKAALLKHLETVRQQGFAVTDEERDSGVWGAAVPLFEDGACVHSLAVVGPKFRLGESLRQDIIDELLRLSQSLRQSP